MVSSTTVKLGDTGYAVAYRMAWGWDMEERVDVFRLDNPTVGQSKPRWMRLKRGWRAT